jgi:hypothetical protein
VGIYFAVIRKAMIPRFIVAKPIRMTFANPFYTRTMHGRVENKPSALWTVGNALTWSAEVPRCTWCRIQYSCFLKFCNAYIRKSTLYGCQMKLCAVCCQLFIRINTADSSHI